MISSAKVGGHLNKIFIPLCKGGSIAESLRCHRTELISAQLSSNQSLTLAFTRARTHTKHFSMRSLELEPRWQLCFKFIPFVQYLSLSNVSSRLFTRQVNKLLFMHIDFIVHLSPRRVPIQSMCAWKYTIKGCHGTARSTVPIHPSQSIRNMPVPHNTLKRGLVFADLEYASLVAVFFNHLTPN